MKNYKYKAVIKRASFVMILLFLISSCDLLNMDVNTDPSNPSTATPDLVLPNVMVSASTTFGGVFNRNIHGFIGMMSVGDDYNLTTASFSNSWQSLYQGPLKDIDEVIKYTSKEGTLPGYLGIAQVLKALYFSYIVDLWGDVPYFSAFNGNNPSHPDVNPSYDNAQKIYLDLFTLLDDAIVNLNAPSSINYATGDPIFGGVRSKWVKAANSLKLKLYVQIRQKKNDLTDLGDINAKVAALIANPATLISSAADDMDFRFNGAQTPDYRHPWFGTASTGGTNAFSYISHQLMFEMLENKDPRFPFYFKRQTKTGLDLTDATQKGTAPCSSTPGCAYGYIVYGNGSIDVLGRLFNAGIISANNFSGLVGPNGTVQKAKYQNDVNFLAGIFGRDRADNSGAPNDASLRTTIGAFPAGGYYDDNFSFAANADRDPTTRKPIKNGGDGGGSGNGVFPMLSSTLVKFYITEAMLTMNVPGSSANVFESAVKEHIDRVSNLSLKVDTKATAATAATRDAYAAFWKTKFMNAATPDLKLDVLWKQAWYSGWGNAIDSYNAFRRTGKPTDLQLPLNRIRQFPLKLPYAIDELTLNKNAPQNAPQFDTPEAALFWDVVKFHF